MKKDDPNDPVKLFWESWEEQFRNSGALWCCAPKPEEPKSTYFTKEQWPAPKERTDLVFAKSCTSANWSCTDAGTTTEPSANFGAVMVAGAMLLPSASTAIATALGADLGLGRMAGGGIMQQRFTWLLRGAGGPASVFILGMLPEDMGDGTRYTDDQLRSMSHAPTRVRFQFRRDSEGELRVYGIHTKASGDDSVRTVQATWNANKTAMEAKLNGMTILWTPREGPLGSLPPLIYPEASDARLGTILVHPIPDDTDSQIEGLPGEDITTDDFILVFPARSGMKSMYVVFARPIGGGDIKYHKPPLTLPAFPDAVAVRRKSDRQRWKSKNRIYEWDYQHGAVEVYDKQGNHLGEFDAETGDKTSEAKPERRITTK